MRMNFSQRAQEELRSESLRDLCVLGVSYFFRKIELNAEGAEIAEEDVPGSCLEYAHFLFCPVADRLAI